MQYSNVTAIINCEQLGAVEKALVAVHAPGVSISPVRGYGEYHNFYEQDMMCRHMRIEIFCLATAAETIAQCIMKAAYTGLSSDGLVAILPVQKLYHIHQQSSSDGDNNN